MSIHIHNLFFRNPKILLFMLMAYVGFALVAFGTTNPDMSFWELFDRHGMAIIGATIGVIGIALAYADLLRTRLLRAKEKSFQDVDLKTKKETSWEQASSEIIAKIEEMKNSTTSDGIDYSKIEELLNKRSVNIAIESSAANTFTSYFNSIRHLLEQKSSVADEKASILLDKGTAYAKGGITFFILSILFWQLLSGIYGFQTQFIYGIASCSVLFIFIEFLSAWFLRQYRHFIDTSTYLIKVKSIFDKFYLVYTIAHEAGKDKDAMQQLLKLLSEDIKWPETYLLKSADISFAKEALETMTHLAKELKKQNN